MLPGRLRFRSSACGRPRTGSRRCRPCDACAPRESPFAGRWAIAGRGIPGKAYRRARSVARSYPCRARRGNRKAGDPAAVHHALHEIVSLHAILVRGAIGEMSKSWFRPACDPPASRNPAAGAPRGSPPANRNISPRSDLLAGALASGTGCRCRWLRRSPCAPD